jgi:hypothetical protein
VLTQERRGRNQQLSVYARPSTDAFVATRTRFHKLRLGWLGRLPPYAFKFSDKRYLNPFFLEK